MTLCFVRCAQVAPLTGGERDTVPPKLLDAKPANATTEFNAKVIELKFDEFVQVRDISNQLVITPQTKELPEVEARGKKIVVKFREDLKPNTTYRIFFGNSIADMHEGNVSGNLEYVFSTGNYIDSLWLMGRIVNAFELSPEKDVMVSLYESAEDDSVVFKKKPLYLSKTSDNGNYRISHLPKSSYRIFAFSDKNKNLMYDGGDEAIAYRDSIVQVSRDTVVDLKLFKEEPSKKYIKKVHSPQYGLTYVIYNKAILNEAEAADPAQSKTFFSLKEMNDTCKIFYYDIYDTLKVHVRHSETEVDTVKIPLPSKDRFEKQIRDGKIKLRMDLEDEIGKIPYYKKPVIQFFNWIDTASIDSSLIKLFSATDTLVSSDPQFKQDDLSVLSINAKLQSETQYFLNIRKGAIKTKSGISNDSIHLSLRTSSPDDYATLRAKLFLPKKEAYIVQLLNEKRSIIAEEYISLSLTSSTEQIFVFKNLLPGNYFLKLIEDKNGNKAWDTGNLINKQQPETIYFNIQQIKIPAGWDSEIEWNVN